MRTTLMLSLILILTGCESFKCVNDPKEVVLHHGDTISVTNDKRTITCAYVSPLKRKYHWDNTTELISLNPRDIRWYGALGIYSPAAWHTYILKFGYTTRICAQESDLNFDSISAFLKWKNESWIDLVYNDQGYAGGWCLSPSRSQLNIDIWRIHIRGALPKHLPGANNEAIKLLNSERQKGSGL